MAYGDRFTSSGLRDRRPREDAWNPVRGGRPQTLPGSFDGPVPSDYSLERIMGMPEEQRTLALALAANNQAGQQAFQRQPGGGDYRGFAMPTSGLTQSVSDIAAQYGIDPNKNTGRIVSPHNLSEAQRAANTGGSAFEASFARQYGMGSAGDPSIAATNQARTADREKFMDQAQDELYTQGAGIFRGGGLQRGSGNPRLQALQQLRFNQPTRPDLGSIDRVTAGIGDSGFSGQGQLRPSGLPTLLSGPQQAAIDNFGGGRPTAFGSQPWPGQSLASQMPEPVEQPSGMWGPGTPLPGTAPAEPRGDMWGPGTPLPGTSPSGPDQMGLRQGLGGPTFPQPGGSGGYSGYGQPQPGQPQPGGIQQPRFGMRPGGIYGRPQYGAL